MGKEEVLNSKHRHHKLVETFVNALAFWVDRIHLFDTFISFFSIKIFNIYQINRIRPENQKQAHSVII